MSKVVITKYDIVTGRLGSVVQCPADLLNAQIQPGESFIHGKYSGEAFYHNGSGVVGRSSLPAVIDKTNVTGDGVDFCTISGVPAGAEIFIGRDLVGVSDGTNIELSFDLPDQHTVKIIHFPYLLWEVVVNAS